VSAVKSPNLNDIGPAELYVVAGGIFLVTLLLLVVSGAAIGLVWWVVATHTHHLWIFLLAGFGFQVARTIKNLILQKIAKGKK